MHCGKGVRRSALQTNQDFSSEMKSPYRGPSSRRKARQAALCAAVPVVLTSSANHGWSASGCCSRIFSTSGRRPIAKHLESKGAALCCALLRVDDFHLFPQVSPLTSIRFQCPVPIEHKPAGLVPAVAALSQHQVAVDAVERVCPRRTGPIPNPVPGTYRGPRVVFVDERGR